MQIKSQKSKILWAALLFLALIAMGVGGTMLFSKPYKVQVSSFVQTASAKPEVLDASIFTRQESLAETQIVQIKAPDLSAISAKSFLVFELASGQTLLEKNPQSKLGIASLTKLMTAFVAYQNADLNKTFIIDEKAIINTNPSLDLLAGDEVKALDIFNAVLVGSCNDAGLVLAEYTASSTGQNFISLMNQQANNLGMANTHFSNVLGFDSQYNYSTADDLKKLISSAEKLSAFTDLGRRTSYEFSGSSGKSYYTEASNKLIKTHPDISAIKTGYTQTSGGSMATKVKIGSHNIVIVVLRSQDREGDTLKLKDEAEDDFSW